MDNLEKTKLLFEKYQQEIMERLKKDTMTLFNKYGFKGYIAPAIISDDSFSLNITCHTDNFITPDVRFNKTAEKYGLHGTFGKTFEYGGTRWAISEIDDQRQKYKVKCVNVSGNTSMFAVDYIKNLLKIK